MSAWPPAGVPTVAELVRARRRAQWFELALMGQVVLGLGLVAWVWVAPGRFGLLGLLGTLAVLPWTGATMSLMVLRDVLAFGKAHRRGFLRQQVLHQLRAIAFALALTSPMGFVVLCGSPGGVELALVPLVAAVTALLASMVVQQRRWSRTRADLAAGRFEEALAQVASPGWWRLKDLRAAFHAELLVGLGDLDGARRALDGAPVARHAEFAVRLALVRVAIAREAGTPEEARAAAVEAVRLVPLSTRANVALAELQLWTGEAVEDALQRLEWAVDAERRDLRALRAGEGWLAVFLASRAWALAVVGRPAEARERLAELEPPTSPVRRAEVAERIGWAWAALGEPREAAAARERGRGLPGQAARLLRAHGPESVAAGDVPRGTMD